MPVEAQQSPDWDKRTLRDSVTALLSKYQILHNQLSSQTDPRVEREFIRLFSNPKVQLVNDIESSPKIGKISAERYVMKIAELFPDGLSLNLDMAGMIVEQPDYDRNNRYVIRVRLHRSLSGITKGRVHSSGQRIIFEIAFNYINNVPGSFSIYGTDLPAKGQGFVAAGFSPAITGYSNSTLKSDERFRFGNGNGYMGNVSYSYFFSGHWGAGSGLSFSHYSGSLSLDRFDPVGGFNPNLSNIVIDNDLWFIDLPVFLTYRADLSKRFSLRAEMGLSFGFRLFETVHSTAQNTNSGATYENVFSDAGWYNSMNRFNLGFMGSLVVQYRIQNRLGIFGGGGIRQGLSGLDNRVEPDYSQAKYLGQFNPLWAAPGKTVCRAIFATIGVCYLLNPEEAK
jgi:hypothetical protein